MIWAMGNIVFASTCNSWFCFFWCSRRCCWFGCYRLGSIKISGRRFCGLWCCGLGLIFGNNSISCLKRFFISGLLLSAAGLMFSLATGFSVLFVSALAVDSFLSAGWSFSSALNTSLQIPQRTKPSATFRFSSETVKTVWQCGHVACIVRMMQGIKPVCNHVLTPSLLQ